MRLSEAFRMYEADKKLEGFSPHTLKAYGLQMKLLIRYLGDKNIEEVTLPELKQYLINQTQHLKPSSLSHRVRFIKSFFRWAYDEALTSRNTASKLREPKLGDRIPKALSEEDLETLREGCTTPLEHALVEFLYSTGCRLGEVTNLNISDIDWDNRTVIVVGKGNKEREVYFSTRCAIWLKKYLEQRSRVHHRRGSHDALFVTERDPHRMSAAQVRYILKRIARRANVDANVYPHKLRHSYATHLLDNGAPLEVIQSFLGHSKLETTRLYAQLSGSRRRELYRRFFKS